MKLMEGRCKKRAQGRPPTRRCRSRWYATMPSSPRTTQLTAASPSTRSLTPHRLGRSGQRDVGGSSRPLRHRPLGRLAPAPGLRRCHEANRRLGDGETKRRPHSDRGQRHREPMSRATRSPPQNTRNCHNDPAHPTITTVNVGASVPAWLGFGQHPNPYTNVLHAQCGALRRGEKGAVAQPARPSVLRASAGSTWYNLRSYCVDL